jgi:class 3 adenylate cyclase/CHASE2 domain-containing sensor protein
MNWRALKNKAWPILLLIALLATGGSFSAIHYLSFLRQVERFLEDFRIATLLRPEPTDADIVIVGIKEQTLALFPYREPVNRGFLADLLQTLADRHPRAVGMDILLDSPTEPDLDAALKRTLRNYQIPLVISYTDNPDEVTDDQLSYLNDFVPQQDRVQANLPEDRDDAKVRVIAASKTMRDGLRLPSFARGLMLKLGIDVPDGETLIVWHGAPSTAKPAFAIIPAERVKVAPKSWFEGKIILIGGYFTLRDQHRTPFVSGFTGTKGEFPGIQIHAHAIAQFLQHRQQNRLTLPLEILLLLGFAAMGTLLGSFDISTSRRYGAAGAILVALFASGGALFYERSILIPLLEPSLALLLATWATEAITGAEAKKQRAFINSAFARYLNPQLVKQLSADPGKLQLGGESRDMTLLFCDIRGFTTISEKFDAQGLTRFINRFLTPMTDLILAHQGTIDKYMGDAIMAFWNAPLDDADHARHACLAALQMRVRLDELNQQWRSEAEQAGQSFIEVHIGIGLNSGLCCVGNVGSDQRFDYSVLGDDVNLASRLEGQSKTYGVDIVIGENTAQAVGDLAILELDSIKVKGKTKPVRIFALVGDQSLAMDENFRYLKAEHDAMLIAFRQQDWQGAATHLEHCREQAPPLMMGLYNLYEERIASYLAAPPPIDWDGVYVALTK